MQLLRAQDILSDEPTWRIINAARDGDTNAIRRLLAEQPEAVKATHWYTMPLHFAVREGHLEAVKLLMEAGADPVVARYGGDPLPVVARDRGHEEVARLLEFAIRAMNVQPEDHEIHTASSAGDLRRVRDLVASDAALAIRGDREGRTPLHRAVLTGRTDLVGFLLDSGADVNAVQACEGFYSAYRYQPIDLALFWRDRNDYAMAGYLLGRGARHTIAVAAALGNTERVRELLDADPDLAGDAQPFGRRPLTAAAARGRTDIVRLLLERGADPNLPESDEAPRGKALYEACKAGDIEMARMLLDHGADPDAEVESSGNCIFISKSQEMRLLLYSHGAKPMDAFSYIFEGNIDAVVLMARADPDAVGRSGCGGAYAAVCTQGRRDWLRVLLALGVRVPPIVDGCRSYLWEHPDMTRELLEHGMDPNLPDWQHVTPLHNICSRDGRGRADENRLELLSLFLEFGANINAIDEEYRSTPLGWAARCNLPDMVKALLERGADPHAAGAPWALPLAWAERRAHEEVMALLREAIR